METLMKCDLDNQVLSNLKDKIDALIENGFELSKTLPTPEKYSVMKRIISEGINKAILNVCKDEELHFTEQELKIKKEQLEKVVQEYFDDKFSEREARTREKKGDMRDV
jgi:hypothetical protein